MMFATLEDAYQTYSDYYKDAYGRRPRFDMSTWTLEEFNEAGESLRVTIDQNNRYEQERQKVAVHEFKTLIDTCKGYGAKDDVEAIRWLLQADNVETVYDLDRWMWEHYISYTPYESYIKSVIVANRLVVN